jgi:hypothetical protein
MVHELSPQNKLRILTFKRLPCSYFLFLTKMVLLKVVLIWRSISIQNFMFPSWLVQVLHPPQKFERPPFWNGWRYGIRKYSVEVTFNDMTSLLNFTKIYQLVQKLLGGGHRQTDRQTGDLISLTFLCKESRLKNVNLVTLTFAYGHLNVSKRLTAPLIRTRNNTRKQQQ